MRPQRRGWGRRRRWGASTLRAAGAIRVGHPKIGWWHQHAPWVVPSPAESVRTPLCATSVGTSLRVWRLVGAAARGTTGPKGSRSDEGRLYGGSAPEWGAVRCGRGVRLSMTPPRHASAPCPCSRCGAGAAVVVAGVPDAPAAVSGCVGLWRLTGHHRGGSRTAAPLRWRRPRPDLPAYVGPKRPDTPSERSWRPPRRPSAAMTLSHSARWCSVPLDDAEQSVDGPRPCAPVCVCAPTPQGAAAALLASPDPRDPMWASGPDRASREGRRASTRRDVEQPRTVAACSPAGGAPARVSPATRSSRPPSRPPFDRPRPAAVPEPGESTLKSAGSISRQFRSSPPAALEPKIGRRSPGARNLPEKYVFGPETRS